MNIRVQQIITLITACQVETAKFRSQQPSDDRYCYELFRRAFEENDNESLAAVYQIYLKLVYFWVEKHPYFNALHLPIEYFVADSSSEFVLAMRKQSFAKFRSVAALLAYWRKCVHSVVSAEYRKQHPIQIDLNSINPPYQPNLDTALNRQAIWARIMMLLGQPNERLLAQLYFVQALKPRQISQLHPTNWSTARHVTVDLQRITRKLRSDDDLRQLL